MGLIRAVGDIVEPLKKYFSKLRMTTCCFPHGNRLFSPTSSRVLVVAAPTIVAPALNPMHCCPLLPLPPPKLPAAPPACMALVPLPPASFPLPRLVPWFFFRFFFFLSPPPPAC